MTLDALVLDAKPAQLAALLGATVPPALVEDMVRSPRLRARLAGLLPARLGDVGAIDSVQGALLAMNRDALLSLALRAGAVWHAAAIKRIVEGAAIRTLVERIGEAQRRVALAGAALAPEAELAAPSPDAIADAVPTDGAACLAAWCEAQPWPVAIRLRLLRPEAAPSPEHISRGPAIITWLARQP